MQVAEKAGMTVPEFAKWAGISRSYAYTQARKGKLRVRKIGARSVIAMEDAKAWFDALPLAKPAA